jgi:SAM-dependent methyltransferase
MRVIFLKEQGMLRDTSIADEELRMASAYAKRRLSVPDNRYSLLHEGNLLLAQTRERQILACLKRAGIRDLRSSSILEVGCGGGFWLREFIRWGARPENVVGVDLLAERVAEARNLCPLGVQVHCCNAIALPFETGVFDIVFQATAFTSVLNSSMKEQMASQMTRVAKARGMIMWYDYHVNNPWNLDVKGISRAELGTLFPKCSVEYRRITLAPPVVRLLARYSWIACSLLEKIPWLCTHHLAVIRPRLPQ